MILLALAAVGIPAALTASAGAKAPKRKPIVIGFSGAQSGFYTLFDVPTLIGMKIAIRDINAKGGVLGRPLKLVTSDSKSDINTGVSATLDVINKGASLVVPMIGADQGGPSARVAQQHGILSITGSGSPKFGYQGVGPLAFNSYPGDQVEATIDAEYAYAHRLRHPYVLCDISDDYNRATCKYFQERFKQLAGNRSIVGYDTYQQKDPSIATQIARLRSSGKYDMILLGDYPPSGASAIRQLRSAGVTVPIYGAAAFDGNYWHGAIPHLSNFFNPTLGSIFGDDPNHQITQVFKVYKRIAGSPPATSVYPLIGYTNVELFARAVAKAHSTAGKKLAAVLDKFHNQRFLVGRISYTKTCHIPIGLPMAMMSTTNGRTHFVGRFKAKKIPPSPC
jgi:branched-chain amino acid transport system substrate-binding protein